VTLSDAESVIKQIVQDTRKKLLKALGRDLAHSVDDNDFAGCCGLAQCIAGYRLQDMGFQPEAFATQSLPEWKIGHAALVWEVSGPCGSQLFLIDPTFKQFSTSAQNSNEQIRLFFDQLTDNGYVELKPTDCEAYLAFFCDGASPLSSAEAAYEFLRCPPRHEYHFSAGDGTSRFDRKELSDQQLLILPRPSIPNSRPIKPRR
jgi:hypothetical protein